MRKFALPCLPTCLAACGLLLLSACSTETKTASTDDKSASDAKVAPTGPVSGKTAYWEMYTKARTDFATDLMPLSLEQKEIPGVANADGKAAMWDATFVSPGKKEMRVFTYAITSHPPDIYKGVTIGKPLPWNGSHSVMPFSMGQVQIDSDAALKSATDDAGSWLKAHPGKTPTVILKELARYQVPTWEVMWGDDKVGYRSFVSGVDGKPITGK